VAGTSTEQVFLAAAKDNGNELVALLARVTRRFEQKCVIEDAFAACAR